MSDHLSKLNGHPDPDERHREFLEENERWNRRVEESMRQLKEIARDVPAPERDGQAARA